MDKTILPALTLHQPWASLIAVGAKPYETRSFPPPRKYIGQRIAIHAAAKSCPRIEAALGYDEWPTITAVSIALEQGLGAFDWLALPRGAVVATAVIEAAYQLDRHEVASRARIVAHRLKPSEGLCRVPGSMPIDLFGDYSPGRWAWLLTDVQRLPEPVPAKGKQGWWTWQHPADQWVAPGVCPIHEDWAGDNCPACGEEVPDHG